MLKYIKTWIINLNEIKSLMNIENDILMTVTMVSKLTELVKVN